MKDYTKETYINAFGVDMWNEKVESINDDGGEIESVYATDNGNIFMIMKKEEL